MGEYLNKPNLITRAFKSRYLSQAGGRRGRQKAKDEGRNGSLRDEKCENSLIHCCLKMKRPCEKEWGWVVLRHWNRHLLDRLGRRGSLALQHPIDKLKSIFFSGASRKEHSSASTCEIPVMLCSDPLLIETMQ